MGGHGENVVIVTLPSFCVLFNTVSPRNFWTSPGSTGKSNLGYELIEPTESSGKGLSCLEGKVGGRKSQQS